MKRLKPSAAWRNRNFDSLPKHTLASPSKTRVFTHETADDNFLRYSFFGHSRDTRFPELSVGDKGRPLSFALMIQRHKRRRL
jgi:hypothetical protein